MSLSPLAYADSLRIGSIEFVSPDEIKVLLDIEAPDGVALNTGTPRSFPRINGYVLIPSDEGHLVAQVEWITIERSQYPKRKGLQDFGLVDLPYPLRKMSLNPLGCLICEGSNEQGEEVYRFRRGVESYPTVGAPVLLPTQNQLRSIVESGDNRRVLIGSSPLAANAKVMVDPDRLFGRHLAVLGNTGSGKSCSVAGLIRWSMDEARKARGGADPNARFIVLDPNGEYANTFRDMSKVRVYAVEPSEGVDQLQVPLWFWNSAEWSAFTQASAKMQRPLLRRALRDIKAGRALSTSSPEEEKLALRRYLSSRLISIRRDLRSGDIQTDESRFGFRLKAIATDMQGKIAVHGNNKLDDVLTAINTALTAAHNSFVKDGKTIEYYRAFNEAHVQAIIAALEASVDTLGGVLLQEGPDEDVPIAFDGSQLPDHLEVLAEQENASQFTDFLVSRIRTLLSDTRMRSIISNQSGINLHDWLSMYIGESQASNGSVTVIDLSLVPAEVVHIITAVIARMTLETLQRYRKLNHGKTLPTVLVMEEAHTFIKRYKDDAENQNSATICCQVFEKIAREGRKFGLGLVLSSQRPSELSPTVLSQCNSYLLHRISNDRDQELVHKLVPDNLRGLLRDLPSLSSRHAILLGWASELPVLVQMRALPENHRPKSDDPDFWAVWSGQDLDGNMVERNVDWKAIADDWQQVQPSEDAQDEHLEF
ncbi:TPA: ATP-binding protein [Pseudomonas aeruginosa]|uniref:Helicase HerA central domain-containing protein n=1 Tax=Pseudomonas aeruginosa TaxID=287 RepID=A0A894X9S4_PSEAI|nr:MULTISPECIES: ATP-binding protein [Pseudomonadota]EIU5018242.1 ATP-binding protein [Pseudomonas aeruginosa]EIZ7650692.1 ATP-binding protein [Pseudomonas aeruginosa]EKM7583016.1 ATP-binding protein [Pseudomonas aeruginosa]EKQ6341386.1 ATP-binding protein [Pseudomonas aeruginosa]EKW9683364.1 ATP-binding protein [Pseudomonas aeruginosa]